MVENTRDPCFNDWSVLSLDEVEKGVTEGPAAFQLRQAEGLVRYPSGKSAMVYYAYAHHAKRAILESMQDEIQSPGVRGVGAIWFRTLEHPRALEHLQRLFVEFERRFGAPPLFNNKAQGT